MSNTLRAPLAMDDYHLGEEPMVVRAQNVEVDLSANITRVASARASEETSATVYSRG